MSLSTTTILGPAAQFPFEILAQVMINASEDSIPLHFLLVSKTWMLTMLRTRVIWERDVPCSRMRTRKGDRLSQISGASLENVAVQAKHLRPLLDTVLLPNVEDLLITQIRWTDDIFAALCGTDTSAVSGSGRRPRKLRRLTLRFHSEVPFLTSLIGVCCGRTYAHKWHTPSGWLPVSYHLTWLPRNNVNPFQPRKFRLQINVLVGAIPLFPRLEQIVLEVTDAFNMRQLFETVQSLDGSSERRLTYTVDARLLHAVFNHGRHRDDKEFRTGLWNKYDFIHLAEAWAQGDKTARRMTRAEFDSGVPEVVGQSAPTVATAAGPATHSLPPATFEASAPRFTTMLPSACIQMPTTAVPAASGSSPNASTATVAGKASALDGVATTNAATTVVIRTPTPVTPASTSTTTSVAKTPSLSSNPSIPVSSSVSAAMPSTMETTFLTAGLPAATAASVVGGATPSTYGLVRNPQTNDSDEERNEKIQTRAVVSKANGATDTSERSSSTADVATVLEDGVVKGEQAVQVLLVDALVRPPQEKDGNAVDGVETETKAYSGESLPHLATVGSFAPASDTSSLSSVALAASPASNSKSSEMNEAAPHEHFPSDDHGAAPAPQLKKRAGARNKHTMGSMIHRFR